MSVYATSADLRAVLREALGRFLTSDGPLRRVAEEAGVETLPVLELHVRDPAIVIHLDVAAGRVLDGPAPHPDAVLDVRADDLHDLLLDRLGPVEISRLVEEGDLHLSGSPAALRAALVLVGEAQPRYAEALRALGRDDLFDTPMPDCGGVWERSTPSPRLLLERRPWQPRKGASAGS